MKRPQEGTVGDVPNMETLVEAAMKAVEEAIEIDQLAAAIVVEACLAAVLPLVLGPVDLAALIETKLREPLRP